MSIHGTHQMHRQRPGRLARLVAGVLVAAAALSAVGGSDADALTTLRGGSPGGVSFNKVQGQYVTTTRFGTMPGLRISGPLVTRSPASAGTQMVWFQATVEQYYDGRWVTVWSSGMRGYSLEPGASRLIDAVFAQVGSGYFRVHEQVYWRDAWNRSLGYYGAAFDTSADYRCGIAACGVGPGYIWI